MSIPKSKHAGLIADCLRSAGSNATIVAGQKIANLPRPHSTKSRSKGVVYKIPCSGVCNKSYIGETGRGLIKRINEHKRDVRNHNRSNAIVLHIEECKKTT